MSDIPEKLEKLEEWLHASEQQQELREHTEKKIVWFDGVHQTDWSIVYVHGFSASRTETDPTSQHIAQKLHANIFYTRLTGHGQDRTAMSATKIESWQSDLEQSFEVGRRLGRKILIVACSTGATLATIAASQLSEDEKRRFVFIFISPNYGLRACGSFLLRYAFSRSLVMLIKGETHTLTLLNAQEKICYTSSYPVTAVVLVLKVIDMAVKSDLLKFTSPILIFYNDQDKTVCQKNTFLIFKKISSVYKKMIEVKNCTSPNKHVLCGAMASMESTNFVVDNAVAFVDQLSLI
jgi:esterase/lipase